MEGLGHVVEVLPAGLRCGFVFLSCTDPFVSGFLMGFYGTSKVLFKVRKDIVSGSVGLCIGLESEFQAWFMVWDPKGLRLKFQGQVKLHLSSIWVELRAM